MEYQSALRNTTLLDELSQFALTNDITGRRSHEQEPVCESLREPHWHSSRFRSARRQHEDREEEPSQTESPAA
jgi:hypothetical protein